jgi:hypothetical protein
MAGGTRTGNDEGRGYRFSYLARKWGLSHQDARNLIASMGHDRVRLNAAAQALLLERQSAGQSRRVTCASPAPAKDDR